MSLHRCTETGCPHFGQRTTKGCGCHKTDEQVLTEQRDELLQALEGLVRYVDAVRRTMPLLKTQQARFDAALAAIAKAKGGAS